MPYASVGTLAASSIALPPFKFGIVSYRNAIKRTIFDPDGSNSNFLLGKRQIGYRISKHRYFTNDDITRFLLFTGTVVYKANNSV